MLPTHPSHFRSVTSNHQFPVPSPQSLYSLPPIYTTCLHCHLDLGTNEEFDHFPVGRRLAFDQIRGRLWVICTTCGRWNLSPLDERLDIIEACERRYRDTRKRVSTDQVGLAKLPDGTTLVRIGKPVFPEYASWRYGQLFVKRDRSALVSAGAGGAAVLTTLVMMGGPVLAVGGGGAVAVATYQLAKALVRGVTGLRQLGGITLADGSIQRLDMARARRARIGVLRDGRWTLAVPEYGRSILRPMAVVTEQGERLVWRSNYDLVHPDNAEMAARQIMPAVNAAGGDEEMVLDSAKLHEQWGGRIGENVGKLAKFQGQPLALAGDPHLSLAFEMSVFEEQEQRWMQTELYLLKSAWQEAEKIAAIADELTLPAWVAERVKAMRARG